MRPTDFLHSEPLTRTLVLCRLPVRPTGIRRLSAPSFPKTLVPRLSPRAHPRAVAAARRPPARTARLRLCRSVVDPEAEGRTPSSSGPLDADETGEARVSRRGPHCSSRRPAAPGVFFRAHESGRGDWRLCRLLRVRAPRSLSRSTRGPEGRQDRLRGGLVKGLRFCRPETPSIAKCSAHRRRPKAQTTAVPSSIMRRSRDEDRHTSMNRSPFAAPGPRALAPVSARA